jgi:hypothetical protein
MKSFNKLIKGLKQQEIVMLIVFVIYVLLEIKTPKSISELADNIYGNVFVIIVALTFFLQNKPVVGIFGLVVAYIFIKRSSVSNGTHAIRRSLPSEKKKIQDFAKHNSFPVTLEEEVVSNMAPLVGSSTGVNVNFKPVLNNTHDATVL